MEGRSGSRRLVVDTGYAVAGGGLGLLVCAAGGFLVGRIEGIEALQLLESVSGSVRFLASGAMTACSTILALILTFLSIARGTVEERVDAVHYRRVKQIAGMCIGALIASLVLLMLLGFPVGETDGPSDHAGTYKAVYYAVVGVFAVVAGLFVTIVLSLYNAIRNLVTLVAPEEGSGAGPSAR